LLRDIYGLEIPLPVKAGDVLVSRWNGEDMDIIATRTIS
jgi:CxxC motif-containing protein